MGYDTGMLGIFFLYLYIPSFSLGILLPLAPLEKQKDPVGLLARFLLIIIIFVIYFILFFLEARGWGEEC